MATKTKSWLWVIPFIMLPQLVAARSTLPFALAICGLLIFIAVWLIRAQMSAADEDATNRKIMGVDRFGIGMLAAMGAFFVLLKAAMIYGGMSSYMLVFAALMIAMLLAFLVAAIITVVRGKPNNWLVRPAPPLPAPEAEVEPDGHGWSTLRPNGMVYTAFVLSTILTFIMLIALANIGSREDWRTQIIPLGLMLLFFGAGAIFTGSMIYNSTIKFNDASIVLKKRFGGIQTWSWSDIRRSYYNPLSGERVMVFSDGRKLGISTQYVGAQDLFARLRDHGFG